MKIALNFYSALNNTIKQIQTENISEDRKVVLQPLIDYMQNKLNHNLNIKLNLICTHNSRRSHLSQIWAQTAAAYYDIKGIQCYSGGTEATALYSKVKDTLVTQGFKITTIAESSNSIYSIQYSEEAPPIIGFSKKYDSDFNPKNNFAAIMTCSQADGDCPFIIGAEKRIPITYEDPKIYDNTEYASKKYYERSMQIATEMFYVFSNLKNK